MNYETLRQRVGVSKLLGASFGFLLSLNASMGGAHASTLNESVINGINALSRELIQIGCNGNSGMFIAGRLMQLSCVKPNKKVKPTYLRKKMWQIDALMRMADLPFYQMTVDKTQEQTDRNIRWVQPLGEFKTIWLRHLKGSDYADAYYGTQPVQLEVKLNLTNGNLANK